MKTNWNIVRTRLRRMAAPLLLFCFLSACSGAEPEAEPYLTGLRGPLLFHDQLSTAYLEALEGVRDYLAAPSAGTLAAAKEGCAKAMETISALEPAPYSLTPEDEEAMGELGMDPTDYQVPFQTQNYEKDVRLQTLSDTLDRLDLSPLMDDVLEILNELNLSFEIGERQLRQVGVNHLLAQAPEEEVAAFRRDFLAGLVSWNEEALPWETDRAVLDARGEALLDGLEDLAGEQAQALGGLYAQALEDPAG